tara:strand:- start:3 stop:575 length:573 start_codon:yes stop_codon:yes gene_type:complete
MRKIIFDIETKNIFEDVGSNNPADLDLSVICTYDSETGQYQSFLEDQLDDLWPIMRAADMYITYNGNYFDIPLLQKYAPFNLSDVRHLDLFEEVYKSSGKKLGLGGIAETTLGIGKSGHGLDAVAWWNSGEIDKIIKYCIDDVKVTKAVYDYAREHKHLKFTDRVTGDVQEISLDPSGWEEREEKTGMLF